MITAVRSNSAKYALSYIGSKALTFAYKIVSFIKVELRMRQFFGEL
ncbi:MAG: hypothetical protein K2P81_01885 [Bacteriovoracaceae bacterium]|nr:hypothetical protein [Bacteriovoracaceae bacterium]